MAKIEEVTALLIDEIESFEKAVTKLQIESEKLSKKTFTVNTSLLDNKFSDLMKITVKGYLEQHDKLIELENKLNKTIIIPKWMIILFSLFLSVFILSLVINYFQFKGTKDVEKAGYEEGRVGVENHIRLFFNDNPKALKQYQEWNEKR